MLDLELSLAVLILLLFTLVLMLVAIISRRNRVLAAAAGPTTPSAAAPTPLQSRLEVHKHRKLPRAERKKQRGTIKLLPGHFDVIAGREKGDRIPIGAAETAIGRGSGGSRVVGHILFDPAERTVSRHQAKVVFDTGTRQFWLINTADPQSRNATRVNGRELGLTEGVVLSEGDVISCGEVELRFRAA